MALQSVAQQHESGNRRHSGGSVDIMNSVFIYNILRDMSTIALIYSTYINTDGGATKEKRLYICVEHIPNHSV